MIIRHSRRKANVSAPVDGLRAKVREHRRAIDQASAEFDRWKTGTGNGVAVGIDEIRGALASVLIRF